VGGGQVQKGIEKSINVPVTMATLPANLVPDACDIVAVVVAYVFPYVSSRKIWSKNLATFSDVEEESYRLWRWGNIIRDRSEDRIAEPPSWRNRPRRNNA
jgi:hypothetical protein